MIIILLGYMASGKSYIGTELAAKLNFKFLDLDRFIESNEGESISHIFEQKGEIYFRKLETKSLHELISKPDNLVLALGGGTPCYANNMELILNSEHCVSVYLQAQIPTLVDRLKKEKAKRPLISHINSDEDLVEFIGKHLFERANYYNKAEIKIPTDALSVSEIVEKIILELF